MVVLFSGMSFVAWAAQPVFDLQGSKDATDQLNTMKEQIEVVKETNTALENQLTAMGSAATIYIAFV